jgi:hypothetical protein
MDWRAIILDQFQRRKTTYIVQDSDDILTRTAVTEYLEAEEIEIIEFCDPVRFRYEYERDFRLKGKTIIVRIHNEDFEQVPWDVYDGAYRIILTFNNVFPMLDPYSLRNVPDEYLTAIDDVLQAVPSKLNENDTIKTIIGGIFGQEVFGLNSLRQLDDLISKYWKQFKIAVPTNILHSLSIILSQNVDISDGVLNALTVRKSVSKGREDSVGKILGNISTRPSSRDFVKVAKNIGQYRAQCFQEGLKSDESVINSIHPMFANWIRQSYRYLPTQTSLTNPVMVHKIPGILLNEFNERVALIVMDGMSFTQWFIIQPYLEKMNIHADVAGTYAWVPTITSVSRQSIFSGLIPSKFSESIYTTRKEKMLWKKFWKENQFFDDEIIYKKSLGFNSFDVLESEANYPQVKVFGCVIDAVDKIVHGSKVGLDSANAALTVWMQQGYLTRFITDLSNLGYSVYITSDHGNVQAKGVGTIRQGVISNTSGQRVRVYSNSVLRKTAESAYAGFSQNWDSDYLPSNYKPLLAKDGLAFVNEGQTVVTHGGADIEEVIVPFVKITKEDH